MAVLYRQGKRPVGKQLRGIHLVVYGEEITDCWQAGRSVHLSWSLLDASFDSNVKFRGS